MYPEKKIYDVAGFPSAPGATWCRSRRPGGAAATRRTCSARGRAAQRAPRPRPGPLVVTTDGTEVVAGAVVVTGGIGTFTPRPLPAGEEFLGRGLDYFVPSSRETSAGRGHRRRRRQRHRLGADARAAGGLGDPRAPPGGVPRARRHRATRCADRRRDDHQRPGHRPGGRRRPAACGGTVKGEDGAGDACKHRWSPRSASPRPRTAARAGASSSATTGTSSWTPRCARTSPASSRPATSPSTTARSG